MDHRMINESKGRKGYKVAGAKMAGRKRGSNAEDRAMAKSWAQNEQRWRNGEYKALPHTGLSRRQLRTCNHPKMIDDSYGNPDSGCMAAHCARCGWSFHHTLY